eukprot:SAG31_NODE_876_length_11307_cov_3.506781_2_plen_190_part_00
MAAGQASTMTGVLAGQHVMAGFLQLELAPWKRLALTRSVALVPALLTAIAADANPRASDAVNVWLNILQALQLPFALLPVLRFTSSRAVMGPIFAIGPAVRSAYMALTTIIVCVNVYAVLSDIRIASFDPKTQTWPILVCVSVSVYVLALWKVVVAPMSSKALGSRLRDLITQEENVPLLEHENEGQMR